MTFTARVEQGYHLSDCPKLRRHLSFPANYKFYQDYNVVTKTNADNDTKAFVDFAVSPEGQEVVASLKHIRVKK